MTVNLNPGAVNLPNGGRLQDRKRDQAGKGRARDDGGPVPARASVNFIPGPDSLQTLISGAVQALKRGVYWDRGTILNLLV
jgi:hypothetical protein